MVNDEEDRAKIVAASLENERRLIAAGKIERWEVVKWVVAANVTLAGSSLVVKDAGCNFYNALLALAGTIATAGLLLVWHYNSRMTGARRAARHLEHSMKIDVNRITKQPDGKASWWRDWQLLMGFWLLIFASTVPVALIVTSKLGCLSTFAKPHDAPCLALRDVNPATVLLPPETRVPSLGKP